MTPADEFDTPDEKTDVRFQVSQGQDSSSYPCLEIISGPKAGMRFSLQEGKTLVGRSGDNDIVLDDSSVSRQHAELVVSPDGVIISDLGSRNGTKVEGQKLSDPKALAHQQVLKIGIFEMRFLTGADDSPPPSPRDEDEVKKTADEEPIDPFEEEEEEKVPEPVEKGEVRSALPPPSAPLPPPLPRASLIQRPLLVGGSLLLLILVGVLAYRFWSSPSSPQEPVSSVPQEGTIGGALTGVTPELEKPALTPVFLDFKAQPIPAKIFFGEKLVGQTPLRFSTNLEAGKTYEAKAYFELTDIGETIESVQEFSLPEGAQVVPIDFSATVGILKVINIPRDIQLYLEASFAYDPQQPKPIKFASITFDKPIYLPYGNYTLELRKSERVGLSQTFLDEVVYRRTFTINEAGPTYEVKVSEADLQNFPVKVTSVPSGTEIYLDDAKVGTTPYDGAFPIGEHIMILRHEGYFDYQEVVKMAISTPYATEITLETSEAGQLLNKANDLLQAGQHQEALGFLVEALQKGPSPLETAQANYLAGSAYLHLSDLDKAYEYFVTSMAHPEFQYPARLGVAHVYFARDDKIRALQLLIDVLVSAKEEKVKSDAALLFQKISPLKSVLYITSDPQGALVFVNGQEISQKTPLILHDLGFGTYRIEFQKPGYQKQETKITLAVSEFRPIAVTLQAVE